MLPRREGRFRESAPAYPVGGGIVVTACEMTASITALANLLASRLSEEELSLLAAQLTQLGDSLATIAVCRSRGEKACYSQSSAY